MLIYVIVGIIFGIVALLLVNHYQKVEMSAGKRIGVYILWLIGLALICFACCWGIAASAEGEPRSMAMGFLVFGGIGIVFALIGFRLGLVKKAVKAE
jgi:ethanolamine transporter EutH